MTPSASAATGGTNRITVPARPQSTAAGPFNEPGVTVTSPSFSLMPTPSETSAARIRAVSRAASRPDSVEGPSAMAARMSARLLIDFEPGTVTRPSTAPCARGAGQPSDVLISLLARSVISRHEPSGRPPGGSAEGELRLGEPGCQLGLAPGGP